MTTYARVQNNTAVEVFVPPAGFAIAQCFHADVAALFTVVPDGTAVGSAMENGAWVAPPGQPAPAPAPTVYSALTPMQFYLAFKTAERILLKQLATTGIPANGSTAAIPQDLDIAEFWATYQLAERSNSPIDPNLDSILEGLAYLANPTAPTPAVITASRIPQILIGMAQ